MLVTKCWWRWFFGISVQFWSPTLFSLEMLQIFEIEQNAKLTSVQFFRKSTLLIRCFEVNQPSLLTWTWNESDLSFFNVASGERKKVRTKLAQTIFIEMKIIPKRGLLLPPSKNDVVQPSDLMYSWIWDISMNLKVLHLYIGHQIYSGTSTNRLLRPKTGVWWITSVTYRYYWQGDINRIAIISATYSEESWLRKQFWTRPTMRNKNYSKV